MDPTTLTDESGAIFLTEAVGADEVAENGDQAEELSNRLFLPLVNVDAASGAGTQATVVSEAVTLEPAPLLTSTLPVTTTPVLTTTALITPSTVITTTVPVTPTTGEQASAATPATIYLPLVASEGP
jgi:hypothetical protein